MKLLNKSLLNQAHALLDHPKVSGVLSAQCDPDYGGHSTVVNTAIHPDDQMLTHSIRMLEDVNQSVSQYFCVALQQYRALSRMLQLAFPQGLEDRLILDFACGYGRALRFLVQTYPASQIWASDIQQDAVTFVGDQFKVNAMVSDASPSQFLPGRKFNFIWVASLFTHLPDHLFREWLVKLYDLLTDDGYLVFSVHDEAILPNGVRLDKNGFLFKPESEISELNSALYGTTHVSETYVRSALANIQLNQETCYVRVPRGLADQQDLYVVPKRSQSMERFAAYKQGAWGWVEYAIANGVSPDASTVLAYVSGWAKSLDTDSSVEAVWAEIDGKRYEARLGIPRPDLAKTWATKFENYGWELRFPIARASESFVSAFAQLSNGERGLIYFGVLNPDQLTRLAPWGHLDSRSISDGYLHLGGWAAASAGRKIKKVMATVNGKEFIGSLGDRRQDVCNALNDQGYLDSGWHVDIPVANCGQSNTVRIDAVAEDGEAKTLFQEPISLDL